MRFIHKIFFQLLKVAKEKIEKKKKMIFFCKVSKMKNDIFYCNCLIKMNDFKIINICIILRIKILNQIRKLKKKKIDTFPEQRRFKYFFEIIN